MTTASVLVTVGSTWTASDKCEERVRIESKDLSAVAARELRETPTTRDQALRLMREWISKNTDIRNVRTDESFLLRFLRHKKYSIPMAQQTLLKYLNLRKYYPEMFMRMDCKDPKFEEVIESGYFLVSPQRDAQGRRVLIYNVGNFDPTKYTCWDMAKIVLTVYESLLEEPADQISGFTHVGDGKGVTTAHALLWNPIDAARLVKWGEQSLPIRHKEIHAVNVPAAMRYAMDFVCSKVSPKIVSRLNVHPTLKSLHSKVDPACLPTSYGGKLSTDELIAYTKKVVLEQRKLVVGLDDMEILSTQGIISSRNKQQNGGDIMSIHGSFRKLDID